MGQICYFFIHAQKNSPFGRFLSFREIFHVLKTFTTQYVSDVRATTLYLRENCQPALRSACALHHMHIYTIVEIYDPICKLVQFGIIVN